MINLILLFVASFSNAQMPGPTPRTAPPIKKPEAVARQEVVKKRTDAIEGQCIVIPSGGNLAASACSEVVLTLQGKGEPIQTRTDRMGMFEFVTEQGQQYKLVSGSKLYEVVEPTKPVYSGAHLEVHLKQKN